MMRELRNVVATLLPALCMALATAHADLRLDVWAPASVGTITSGTWNGSTIALGYGGTGKTSIASGTFWYASALDTLSEATLTAFGRSLLDDADEATFKATVNLEIGTDVQAYDAELAALAGLTFADDYMIIGTGAGTVGTISCTVFAQGLLDDATAGDARSTIGLGSVENTALSTWAGSANLTTLGTIGTCGGLATTGVLSATGAAPQLTLGLNGVGGTVGTITLCDGANPGATTNWTYTLATYVDQDVTNDANPSFSTLNLVGTNSLNVGTASTNLGQIVFKNATNANTATVQSGATATSYTLTLPTAAPGGTYLLNMTSAGAVGYDSSTYLTAEADTLATVVGRGSNTGNASITIGNGAAGIDYTLTFDGETNDGVITWMEDEDRFEMACDLTVSETVKGNAFCETVYAKGNVSGAVTITFTDGGTQTMTASAEITGWTGAGFPAGCGGTVTVILDTNGQTIASTGLTTAGGTGISWTADGIDIIVLFSPDGGTTVYAFQSGADMQ